MNIGRAIAKPLLGRRFAIGDIHGCFNTMEVLIEDVIKLQAEDQLFLLGDYIDRGKRNREVLEYIIELQQDGFQIFPLMGNHDYMVLRAIDFCSRSPNTIQVRDYIESPDILDFEKNVEPKFVHFIQSLPYYYELDKYILVHAGLDFEEEFPLKDKMSMIYSRNFSVDRDMINGKILIHGHTPISYALIKEQIKDREVQGRINLDNGCVFAHFDHKKGKGLGSLCALNLDTLELLSCENID